MVARAMGLVQPLAFAIVKPRGLGAIAASSWASLRKKSTGSLLLPKLLLPRPLHLLALEVALGVADVSMALALVKVDSLALVARTCSAPTIVLATGSVIRVVAVAVPNGVVGNARCVLLLSRTERSFLSFQRKALMMVQSRRQRLRACRKPSARQLLRKRAVSRGRLWKESIVMHLLLRMLQTSCMQRQCEKASAMLIVVFSGRSRVLARIGTICLVMSSCQGQQPLQTHLFLRSEMSGEKLRPQEVQKLVAAVAPGTVDAPQRASANAKALGSALCAMCQNALGIAWGVACAWQGTACAARTISARPVNINVALEIVRAMASVSVDVASAPIPLLARPA